MEKTEFLAGLKIFLDNLSDTELASLGFQRVDNTVVVSVGVVHSLEGAKVSGSWFAARPGYSCPADVAAAKFSLLSKFLEKVLAHVVSDSIEGIVEAVPGLVRRSSLLRKDFEFVSCSAAKVSSGSATAR